MYQNVNITYFNRYQETLTKASTFWIGWVKGHFVGSVVKICLPSDKPLDSCSFKVPELNLEVRMAGGLSVSKACKQIRIVLKCGQNKKSMKTSFLTLFRIISQK